MIDNANLLDMEYLFHMISAIFAGLLSAWPITVILIAAVVITLIDHSPLSQRDYNRHYLMILLPCTLTILILLSNASSLASISLVLILAHVPVTAFLARRFWEYQGFVVTVGAFQMWVSMVAAFMGSAGGLLWFWRSFD